MSVSHKFMFQVTVNLPQIHTATAFALRHPTICLQYRVIMKSVYNSIDVPVDAKRLMESHVAFFPLEHFVDTYA